MKKTILSIAITLFSFASFSQSIGMHNDLDADSIPNLINYSSAQNNTLYIVKGKSFIGDGGLRFYYYNSSSTATVDGESVLSATGMGTGRFIKLFNDYNYLINKPTIPTQTSQLSNNSGFITASPTLSINSNTISISNGNSIVIPAQSTVSIAQGSGTIINNVGSSYTISTSDYYNSSSTSGGTGQVTFYLTSDKTSSGTGLYSTIDYVNPLINSSTVNYTYGWAYNSSTKALTVTAQYNPVIILLSTSILGALSPVPNSTTIQVLVKGH